MPHFYQCRPKVFVSQASSTYLGDLFLQGGLCKSNLICDSCRQTSMPYPMTEDSRDDKLQGDSFQDSAQSPSESKCIPTESGTESGSITCGSGHDYFYPHQQIQVLDRVVGLVASSTSQLLSLLSPASSTRPTILSLPDVSPNDKGDPQYLQPDQSSLDFDNHPQNSNLRQSLELLDHGVIDVFYKNQVNPCPTRYVVDPAAATIRLFCFYRLSTSSFDILVQ